MKEKKTYNRILKSKPQRTHSLTHNRSLLIPAYYANSIGFERKAALEVLIIKQLHTQK